jgi:nicotinamidase-related amidase
MLAVYWLLGFVMLLQAGDAGLSVRMRLAPEKTAVIVCDMWDRHWCGGASERVAKMAPRVNAFLDGARRAGALVIHAPSDTMEFYKDYPQRKAVALYPMVKPAVTLELPSPPLPIDDKDGGCDTDDKFFKAWRRQHEGIRMGAEDLITDKGEEVYAVLQARGIEHLVVLGVHTNMCVLNRSFAIKQMTKWGVRTILARDLTDAMYDPKDAPYVSHDRGTELVVEYIEKHWAPTALSDDILKALTKK